MVPEERNIRLVSWTTGRRYLPIIAQITVKSDVAADVVIDLSTCIDCAFTDAEKFIWNVDKKITRG